jgi:hypothetical protein
MTDSPAAMLVMPLIGTDEPKAFELSSIFKPLTISADGPVLVNSNQSAAKGVLPLA